MNFLPDPIKFISFRQLTWLILLSIAFNQWANAEPAINKEALADTITLYVSPKGKDTNSGKKDSPLKTFEGAKNAVRALRESSRDTPIVVYFRGGLYPLTQTITFDNQDSGSERAPVCYRAYQKEEPVFSGSVALTKWEKLKDKNLLKQLPEAVRNRVYVTDAKAAGIQDYGDPTELGARPELFCNEELQTLARWPNSGFVQMGKAKGKTAMPPTYISQTGTREGIAEYLDPYQNRWANEKDIRVGGYWYWDWTEQFHKVAKWDTLTKTFHIAPPYHQYGYRDGARYFALNLFCEIDQPGEWYLDRSNGKLYWYPPAGINPGKAEVRLTLFGAPYMIEMQDTRFVHLEGLTFREGRGSAISIKGGENCLISGCRIQRFGRDGIHITDGVKHGIRGSLLEHFGCGGIRIKGGDRRAFTSPGHFIEHCIVEHFSVFKRTYEPAVHLDGFGHRVSHSRFRYSSSSAFRVEGNDFLIEYNQVSQVVNESDDQGGIDIFYNPSYQGIVIRYNHWSDIQGGTNHGAAGVRLDDMISGVTIYGNIFERAGARQFGGVQINGGKDNVVENNLFYQCLAAVSFSTWDPKRWLSELEKPILHKKIFEDVDVTSPAFRARYPLMTDIRENINVNRILRNVIIDCKQPYLRGQNRQIMENNRVLEGTGKPLSTFLTTSFFEESGLKPIPFREIGPQSNRWKK